MDLLFQNAGSMIDLLDNRALCVGDRIAYQFVKSGNELETITYRELSHRAKRLALYLKANGASGQRVVIMFPTGIDYIVAFFACLYANAIAVPVYEPRQSSHVKRLVSIIHDCKPYILLSVSTVLKSTSRDDEDELTRLGASLICIDQIQLMDEVVDHAQYAHINKDDIAFLQYTSGSTGSPKGVMVSHGCLLHNCKVMTEKSAPHENPCMVTWLPPYHDMGLIGGLLQPMYAAYLSIILTPVSVIQRPIKWLETISKYKATASGGPNFMYEACVRRIREEQLRDIDLSSWNIAFNGAEPVNMETLNKFSKKFSRYGFKSSAIYPCYGLAESTLMVSAMRFNQGCVFKQFDKQGLLDGTVIETKNPCGSRVLVSSGQVHNDLDVKIVNPETLAIASHDEIGEIWIKGESVARGYWQKNPHPDFNGMVHSQDGPYLRTGDLGFICEDELYIAGRLKDVIIIRGKNHYPQDIEFTAMNSHVACRHDAVAAFSIEFDDEEALIVMAELEKKYLDDSSGVVDIIKQKVFTEHELKVFEVVVMRPGSIPKTSSGKIKRRACKDIYLSDSKLPNKEIA